MPVDDRPSIEDLDSWKWVERNLGRTLSPEHRRAVAVICSIAPPYRVGIKWEKAEWWDFGAVAVVRYGELATFDQNDLTRLVIAAHDHRMRVSLEGIGPHYMRICVHSRASREGSISERHPTIVSAVIAHTVPPAPPPEPPGPEEP